MSQTVDIKTLIAQIKALATRAGGVNHDLLGGLLQLSTTLTSQAELLTRATDRLTRLEAWGVEQGYTPPNDNTATVNTGE